MSDPDDALLQPIVDSQRVKIRGNSSRTRSGLEKDDDVTIEPYEDAASVAEAPPSWRRWRRASVGPAAVISGVGRWRRSTAHAHELLMVAIRGERVGASIVDLPGRGRATAGDGRGAPLSERAALLGTVEDADGDGAGGRIRCFSARCGAR